MTRAPSAGALPAGALLLAALVLGGCGTAAPQQPPPAAATPTQAPAPALPWPVGDAGLAALQSRVDAGAQPWLLDPAAVATSFGAAAYGWPAAQAELPAGRGGSGLPVVLRGPDGALAHLLLAQPGRTGRGGVWVVVRADGPGGA